MSYTHADVERLVQASHRAAAKLKIEYDRVAECQGDVEVPIDESWAESEALWEALEPFVGDDDIPF